MTSIPAYLRLHERNCLSGRLEAALALHRNCSLRPRKCGVDRLNNEKGKCHTESFAILSSYGIYLGGYLYRKLNVNNMDRCRPCYKASGYDKLNRGVSEAEFQAALAGTRKAGLVRLNQGVPGTSLQVLPGE